MIEISSTPKLSFAGTRGSEIMPCWRHFPQSIRIRCEGTKGRNEGKLTLGPGISACARLWRLCSFWVSGSLAPSGRPQKGRPAGDTSRTPSYSSARDQRSSRLCNLSRLPPNAVGDRRLRLPGCRTRCAPSISGRRLPLVLYSGQPLARQSPSLYKNLRARINPLGGVDLAIESGQPIRRIEIW
jgi:hypothetical protein